MSKFAQPKWELDRIFAEGQVAAHVERLSVNPVRYSYKIGVVPQNGVFKPFFDPRTDPQVILRVATLAHDYIVTQYAEQREALIVRRREEEAAAQVAAKKAAEKDANKARKKANHEANIARRREEDRQRTQVGKDGNRTQVK